MQKKILFINTGNSVFTRPIIASLQAMEFQVYFFDNFSPNLISKFWGVVKNRGLIKTSSFQEKLNLYINDSLYKKALQINPDYIFVAKGKNISSEVISNLRSKGYITMNWFPDYFDSWPWISTNASAYDYFFTPCLYVQKKLKEKKINSYYLPFGADADARYKSNAKDYDATFVGQYTKRRGRLFQMVHERKFLEVWGYQSWQRTKYKDVYHGVVPHSKCLSIIRRSKITLNTVTCEDGVPIISVNYRPFEASGVGGFVLSWYHEPLGDFFEIGKEMETFSSPEEALEKTEYYLKNAASREKIAYAGWRRTMREHTLLKRMQYAFDIVRRMS